MNRRRAAGLGAALAALLVATACNSVITFAGTGLVGPLTYQVELRIVLYGSILRGSYTLEGGEAGSGTVGGDVSGTLLTMVLFHETGCEFDFEGTISESRLTGDYAPSDGDCGPPGSWDLDRVP